MTLSHSVEAQSAARLGRGIFHLAALSLFDILWFWLGSVVELLMGGGSGGNSIKWGTPQVTFVAGGGGRGLCEPVGVRVYGPA